MTEKEVLLRDIATVKATIDRDWADLNQLSLAREERRMLRVHIERCVQDLKALMERLDELPPESN
ncbi:MAG: hypothetical protein P8Y71_00550 [Pseudolabrys sp.]|jgi:hypothetical protein